MRLTTVGSACARCRSANTIIDNMRVELESLRGRSQAVRIAGEEALRCGVAWGGQDVLRYAAVAKATVEPPSVYHSDEMRELLAQSIVATSRRMAGALDEAARARRASERADAEGAVSFEQAFPPRMGAGTPIAEQAARLTTRTILVGANRAAAKLRAALAKLENEATTAQVRCAWSMSCKARMRATPMHSLGDKACLRGSHTIGQKTCSSVEHCMHAC